MFMIGIILLIAGIIGSGMLPAQKYGYEWRDCLGVFPIIIGFVMCVVSLGIWAFRNLP